MVLKNKWSYYWIISTCLVVGHLSLLLPSITDPHFIKDCVKQHNIKRANSLPTAANMKEMTWDHELAELAKSWAKKCIFQHNRCLTEPFKCGTKYKFVGENIWLGPVSAFSPESAVSAWYNETHNYDYDTHNCTAVCGHYTQVVWAETNKIGCALEMCPNLAGYGGVMFVCDYGPSGNYENEFPYIKGEACTMCEKDEICEKNLCKDVKAGKPESEQASKKPSTQKPKGSTSQQKAYNVLALCLVSIFPRVC